MIHTKFEWQIRVQETLRRELGLPFDKSKEGASQIAALLVAEGWENRQENLDLEVPRLPAPSPADLAGLEQSVTRTMFQIALVQVLMLLAAVLWLVWAG